MESENASPLREAEWCDLCQQGRPCICDETMARVQGRAALFEEVAKANAAEAAAAQAAPEGRAVIDTPPAPTGGGHPYGVAYYFTANVGTEAEPIYQTCVREVAIPHDAMVECVGNTLVVRHEGVADTFRIGRVRPLET